jgi:hypothetical protein
MTGNQLLKCDPTDRKEFFKGAKSMDQKCLIVTIVAALVAVMGSSVSADLYTFSFDSPSPANGSTALQTEAYMEDIYMHGVSSLNDITVWASDRDGLIITNTTPLGGDSDQWLQADNIGAPATDGFKISFNNVPIVSVSFDWAVDKNNFLAEADGKQFFLYTNPDNQAYSGSTSYTFASPVTELYFHAGGSGWVGIDNLVVAPVPIPAAVLLGMLGLGAAGWKLRKSA